MTPRRFLAVAILLWVALFAVAKPPQNTSAIVQFNQPMAVQTSLAACTWPTGVATTGMMAICPVSLPSGTFLATSYQGGAFTVPTVAAAPSPTTISCTNASLSTGTSGTLTASGCVIK